MKRAKKLLSLLLAIALVLTIVPFSGISASAYDAPTLNDEGYYEISTADHLYWFAEQVNSGNNAINGILMNDIVVNENVLVDGELNTDEAVVSAFKEWTPIGGTAESAFEGFFDGQNYKISGLYFNDSATSVVGLFGVSAGTIKNITVTDSYFHGDEGVAGIVSYSIGTVENCCNESRIEGVHTIGGIIGVSEGAVITNCKNTGDVSGTSFVGGILGLGDSATITDCINNGVVKASGDLGGIAGAFVDGSGTYGDITGCCNDGEIITVVTEGESRYYTGGIVGRGPAVATNCCNNGKVTGDVAVGGIAGCGTSTVNCHNTGAISGNLGVGGITGENFYSSDCTNRGEITGLDYVGGISGIMELGSGIISNCKNYGVINSDNTNYAGGIVAYSTGTVEKCENFGEINGKDWDNDETNYANNLGGIVGYNTGIVKKCGNSANVYDGFFVGGVCGNNKGTITDCYNSGYLSTPAGDAGGICSWNNNDGTIENSYNIGGVFAITSAGGICSNANGTFENCYYLTDCAENSMGITQNGIGSYDTAIEDVDGSTTAKSADQFASGEVAYLLNSGVTDGTQVWYQNIDNGETVDTSPKFAGGTVLKLVNGDEFTYSNSCSHNFENGVCSICGTGFTGIAGNYIYKNNVQLKAYQLVEFDGDFYFIGDKHEIVKNKTVYLNESRINGITYADGTEIEVGFYDFDENGKMVMREGIVDNKVYKNNTLLKAYQLVEVDGDFYFIGDRHEIVKNKTVYLTEAKINGITYADGTPITVGHYEFDENGKMVMREGVVDNKVYKNNTLLKAYQLVEVDGDFYFIGDRHEIIKNRTAYLTEARINGLTYADGTPITVGYYEFDENGKMIMREGLVGNSIYKNNTLLKAYQLVEVDGDFYFIGDRHEIIKNGKAYLTEERINGLTYADGTQITTGWYDFNEDGKLVILNGVVGNYIYKNNVQLKGCQLVEVDGDFYYIDENNEIVRNMALFFISEETINGLTYADGTPIKEGYYVISEDGKLDSYVSVPFSM